MAEDTSAARGRYRGLSAVPADGIGSSPEQAEPAAAPELLHDREQGGPRSEQAEPAHRELSRQRTSGAVHAQQHHQDAAGLPGQVWPSAAVDRRHQVAANLEWCWAFIEHNCILRMPPDRSLLVNFDKGLGNYQ